MRVMRGGGLTVAAVCRCENGASGREEGPYLAHEGAGVGCAVHRGLGVPYRLPVPLRLGHLVQLSGSTTGFVSASAVQHLHLHKTISTACAQD